MQTKKHSFIEACTQVFSGMAISFGSYALFNHCLICNFQSHYTQRRFTIINDI